jgi:glutathione S-transferase
MVGGIAAYHLFPDFVGDKDDSMRAAGSFQNGKKMIYLAITGK